MEVKRYVGIENENIYNIQYQLDSDEIRRFEELKRALAITSDENKKDEIRHKMATILGKEMTEEDSPKATAKQEEKKEESKKAEVVEEEFGAIPDTLEEIRMEYDKINEELIKGNKDPRLFERFLQLNQMAEKLQEQEKAETEVQSEPEIEVSNVKENKSETNGIELTPEELKMLLGDPLEVGEPEGEEKPEKKEKVKKWFRDVAEKVASIASRKEKKTDENTAFDTYEKADTVQTAIGEDFPVDEIPMEEYPENEETFMEEEKESEISLEDIIENDGRAVEKEQEDADEMMEEDEYVSYEEIIGQEVEVSDEAIEGQFRKEEKDVSEEDVKPEKQEENKRDPFQVLTEEQQREMAENIATMVLQMLNEKNGNRVIPEEKTEEVVPEEKTEEIVQEEKTATPNDREKAIARAQLKIKIRNYLQEHRNMQFEGHLVTDLPSKMILAEYELTGKLEKPGLIVTTDNLAFEMSKDGSVKRRELGNKTGDPCQVARKEQSQLGLGDRGRRAMGGIEPEF